MNSTALQDHKIRVSNRELEALVLSRAASRLRECQNDWDAHDRNHRLESALKYNQTLWSIFQEEWSKVDNPLPKDLQRQLLNLSDFIDKRTFEILAYPSPEKLSVVININDNLAAGLMESPDNIKDAIL